MKKWLQKHWQGYMLRPLIYKAFTRFVLALTAALLWNHFVAPVFLLTPLAYAFVFVGVFFAVCAWLNHLRMDGLKLPRLKLPTLKKKPARSYGDIMDYTDEEVISFDELEDDEKDVCSMFANLICCLIFLLLSLIV